MIDVVLWDIDGTLLDFSAAERAALGACFDAFGLGPCSQEQIARYSEINRRYWNRLERGELEKQQVLVGRFETFFRQEGLRAADPAAFNREYQLRLGDTICFRDHSDRLIRDLKGRVKQYAVTNGTSLAQARKLDRSGLTDLLDGAFISDRIGAEKPSPVFFDFVFSHIPPVPRENILIVGDSLTSDMAGGARAGIRCCWYNPDGLPRPDSARISFAIRDLNELRPRLLP